MSDLSDRISKLPPEKRAILEKMLMERAGTGTRGIPKREAQGPCPASFPQRRLWFLDRLRPGGCTYNEPVSLRFEGPLDVEALNSSLSEIVRRHEALRTAFPEIDGEPCQRVCDAAPADMPLVDLRDLPEGEREDKVRALARELAREPFDLQRGPLVRFSLFRLSGEDHVLVSVIHHIIFDGWSGRVFQRELAECYNAFSRAREPDLPELPIQCADFSQWQAERLSGAALEKQLSYWRERLEGLEPVELPIDHPRPATQTFAGGTYEFLLPKDVLDGLKDVSKTARTTLFMTLMAGFQTLLGRYTGQEDFALGSPVANRTRVEMEGLIGFFVNNLVSRADLSGDPPFAELLERVRASTLKGYENQELPFARLVEELRPERHMSRAPLIQVMFAFQNMPGGAGEFEGVRVSRFRVEPGIAKFELTLFVQEQPEGIRGRFEYNSDLFDAVTVERMAGHYRMLLESTVDDPSRRLSELSLLTGDESRTMLIEWNDTATDYPRDALVHELFLAKAREHPDAVALKSAGESISYGELARLSSKLAAHLEGLGVEAGAPVGICLERSPEMIVAVLGVLIAGGAYVPLDPDYPRERLEFLVGDSGAAALVTSDALAPLFEGARLPVVRIDGDREAIEAAGVCAERAAGDAADTCMTIYTSGSTGRPKGAAIPHRAVTRLVCNTNYIDLRPQDTIAQVANFSFDAATFEIWGALLNGASLAIIPREAVLSADDFAHELRVSGVSIMFITTALLNVYATQSPGFFAGLRCLLFGGETADPNSVREVLERGAPGRLLHFYGPTESTTFTTWYEVENVPEGASSIPIGRPVANTTVYILDANLQPVPVGVPGEIMIGGDGLASAYVGRAELTAERFIDNPFGASGEKLYRTGDVARFLDDGNIDFIGRRDFQVKLRGFRIELGEIEAALVACPRIDQAVVLCRESRPGEKSLVAYVTGADDISAGDLRGSLERVLPDYMVPAAFVVMDSLPLTPNGKVDRRALPKPEGLAGDGGAAYLAPRTPVEAALAGIWANALGVGQVGVRDDFFSLGGHSLLAVKVFSEIESVFGKKLPLATLFEAPTVEKLVGALSEEGFADVFPPLVEITSEGAGTPFFAVATADAFVFADLARSMEPKRPFYALHPQGIVHNEHPEIDLVDIARRYIGEMKKRQPEGPYAIGGTCAAGIVAYEMAQQLTAAGDEVHFVVMFDSPGPFDLSRRLNIAAGGAKRFGRHMRTHAVNLARLDNRGRLEYIRMRLARLGRKLRGLPVPPDKAQTDRPVEQAYWMAFNGAYGRAVARYKPRRFDGALVLFLAEDQAAWRFSHSRIRWKQLVGGKVELFTIPGSHQDMLRQPQADAVARHLSALLSQVDGA